MEAEVKIIDFKQIKFNNLESKRKEHVVKFMQEAIEKKLCAHTMAREVHAMLDQVNPFITFMKLSDGKKTFTIDDSDERLSKFLVESYIHQLKKDPELDMKILKSTAERVDGTPRMKVK